MSYLAAILDFLKSFRIMCIIEQDEAGVRQFCGKNPQALRPGFYFLCPILSSVQKIGVKTQVVDIPDQSLTTSDGVVILLSCTIEYCIDDVVKACLEILDYDEAIQTYATATISDCVSRNTRQKIHDWEEIQDEILGELQAVGESWGLDIISIGRNQFAKHKVFRVIQG
jgi:regulator of protease activity HflC (stomatin/prohibitin superfamily)